MASFALHLTKQKDLKYGKEKHWQILQAPPMYRPRPKRKAKPKTQSQRVTAAMLRLECVRQGLPDQVVMSGMTKQQLIELITSGDTTLQDVARNNIKPNPFSLKSTKLLAQLLSRDVKIEQCENRDQMQLQLMLAKLMLDPSIAKQTSTSSPRVRKPPKKKRKTKRNLKGMARQISYDENRKRGEEEELKMKKIKSSHSANS